MLVFGKTPLANRSLTDQFARRGVRKKYLLLTDREVPRQEFTAKSTLLRAGEKYASRPGGEPAETRFTPMGEARVRLPERRLEPGRCRTADRTHPSDSRACGRKRFSDSGRPLYGGAAAARVYLHAAEIALAAPGHRRAGEVFGAAEFRGRIRDWPCGAP